MSLRLALLSLLMFACLGASAARSQTSTDANEGSQLSQDPSTGAYTFSWWGQAGRTYFLQQSDDLQTWTYLPVIESGADQVIQWNFTSNQPRFFLRLKYTDIYTYDPFNDDFDGDGVSNWNELLQGTDPLDASLDSNGLPLDWEKFYKIPVGTDANALAPRGDGLTYLQAFQQGLNPIDFYNGIPPTMALLEGGDQRGDPGTVLPIPISVMVTGDGDSTGMGYDNAPVAFSVSAGNALLGTSADGTGAAPAASVQARTSVATINGVQRNVARVYVYLPSSPNDQSAITASVTTEGTTTAVYTTAITSDPSVPQPTSFLATPISSTSVQLTWTGGDSAHGTALQVSLDGGITWHTVGVVGPGVHTANISGLTPNTPVSFRAYTTLDGTGTMPTNGSIVYLPLPSDAGSLPATGGGSAASTVSVALPSSAPLMLAEVLTGQPVFPQGFTGFLQTGDTDTHYLTRSRTEYGKVTSSNSAYNYTTNRTASITVDPLSPVRTYTSSGFDHPLNSLEVEAFFNDATFINDPAATSSTTNVKIDSQLSKHVDQYAIDQDGNTVSADISAENKEERSQPFTLSDWQNLSQSQATLGTGPIPGSPQPLNASVSAEQVLGFMPYLFGPYLGYQFEYLFGRARFQWKVNGGANRTMYWDEQFTPYDPNFKGFNAQQTVHSVQSWQSQGATDSPIYTLDPLTRNAGQYGLYNLIPLNVALVPDYDHNRVINDDDRDKATTDHPFRFWINDDNDSGDTDGDDIPSSKTIGRNCDDDFINGARDLVDFFPVYLDIAPLLQQFPTSSYTYYLRQNDAALNFITTDLTADHAGDYLTNVDAANTVLNLTYDPQGDPVYAKVTGIASDGRGTALDAVFLNKITPGSNKGVILVEAKCATSSPLVLTVVANADPSHALIALQMPLSIDSVEKMFRHKNLRALAGGSGGQPDRMDSPANLPDAECNNKTFVFVHGYNVNGEEARGAQCEVFKRLYWSGSHARFVGVSWYGDDSQIPVPVFGSVTPNYQINIEHAFATSSGLADFLNQLRGDNGDVTLCAHSLGNMLVGSTIQDWNAVVDRYYMMDCAVAKEAYDQTEEDLTSGAKIGMENADWANYSQLDWCSYWFVCFLNDDGTATSDKRSGLTWKGRFDKVTSRTTCYNFYSSGEDVLSNPQGSSDPAPLGPTEVWNCQERLKGLSLNSSDLLTSAYGGWRINTSLKSDMDNGVQFTKAQLRINPCFDHESPASLYGASGSDYLDDKGVTINQLLAEMVPCLSYATGSNYLKVLEGRNFDVMLLENQWPPSRGDTSNWKHGDFRSVAYVYVYRLYENYVSIGSLAIKPNP